MSWDDLKRQAPEAALLEDQASIYAEVFGTPAGLRVLRDLREMTIEKPTPPEIPHGALLMLEGARNLVRTIEVRVANGRRDDNYRKLRADANSAE